VATNVPKVLLQKKIVDGMRSTEYSKGWNDTRILNCGDTKYRTKESSNQITPERLRDTILNSEDQTNITYTTGRQMSDQDEQDSLRFSRGGCWLLSSYRERAGCHVHEPEPCGCAWIFPDDEGLAQR